MPESYSRCLFLRQKVYGATFWGQISPKGFVKEPLVPRALGDESICTQIFSPKGFIRLAVGFNPVLFGDVIKFLFPIRVASQ